MYLLHLILSLGSNSYRQSLHALSPLSTEVFFISVDFWGLKDILPLSGWVSHGGSCTRWAGIDGG